MRTSAAIVADVTTFNFNLMFEIGYAVGLGLPVIPIRDTSVVSDSQVFQAVGILDTFGYEDFANSDELTSALIRRLDSPFPNDVEYPERMFRETRSTCLEVQLIRKAKLLSYPD